MNCTRCEGTGFLNLEQIEDESVHDEGADAILKWIKQNTDHDVCVCDCCGDSEEGWYGEPGEHSFAGGSWDTPDVPDCI